VSDVSVSVRVTSLLADRRFAICLDPAARDPHGPWVIDLDDARALHRELGIALDAVQHLGPEAVR